nr:formylglycine-generating enzyme family protein [Desulforhopalus vacuolatus]
MEFVLVKGGCYQMGDTFGDGYDREKPVHEVCVNDFYMGKYEVTQGEWQKIMGSNPSYFKSGMFKNRDRYPVEQVSWNDITENFLPKLKRSSGKSYRLPTEAEWEYAAREGGKKVRFGNGKDIADPREINFNGRSDWKESYSRTGVDRGKTTKVGSFTPNSLGLYDISGNVWEWCSDWYGKNYYDSSSRHNPEGSGSGSDRVLRGGSWSFTPGYVRAANRYCNSPGRSRSNLGFRLVFPVH